MTIRTSVVMPAFNAEREIEKSLRSILGQEEAGAFEVLVVDDRSSDRTVEVVTALAREHPEIRCIPNSRKKGPSGARNTGLLEAKGRYIAFLDADDLWLPRHLAKSLEFLDRVPGIGGVLHDFKIIDADTGALLGTWHGERRFARALSTSAVDGEYRVIDAALLPALLEESFLHLQATVLRRSVCDGILFNEGVFRSEDRDFAIQLARNPSLRLAFSNEITGCYLRRKGSLTSGSAENTIAALRDHVYLFEGYLRDFEDPEVRRTVNDLLFDRFLQLTYHYRSRGAFRQAYDCLMASARHRVSSKQVRELAKLVLAYSAAKIKL